MDLTFAEWFNQRYIEWRGDRYGQDVSVSAFARWLGLKQAMVDVYLKGISEPRRFTTINRLVDKFGPDVYQALGLNIQSEEELVVEINNLPPELYPELIKRIRELHAEYIVRQSARKGNAGRPASKKSDPG